MDAWFVVYKRVFIGLMTTKLWKIAERRSLPPGGRGATKWWKEHA